ncbi:gustatory receptor for sugar taste 64f-like [Diorhabda sublineata]|uniref:gustatory receptor for sugar taste 64f-like n=1 Tax=Diorhabda sublineata TaxID=1163346 RepID=UPI0024E0AE45|nr:gustatory receptor for sugar taste 64f-like [Diorhabda sublineata]
MMLSFVLAYRFEQVHYNIKHGLNRKYDWQFWAKMREDYTQVAILCQKVNKKLATVIIISFGANIYFIVTQLYKGLMIKRTMVQQFYFMYSFGILLVRAISVTFFSSMVHSQSKKPLSYLICLSNEIYNKEIERFISQVRFQDTSLSGGEYFVVTRGLLFQMAAIIITYELFLIQTGINIYL